LFRKQELLKDNERKFSNNLLSLHICRSGTLFDPLIPCIKATFIFDPKHSIESVVDSIQDEEVRVSWDPFLETVKVLETSSSGRMQVVRTRYKPIAN